MKYYVCMKLVLVLYVSWVVVSLCHAQPYKAVNLGNWFVIEKWMKPSLFDGIPNNDLLVTPINYMLVTFTKKKKKLYVCHSGIIYVIVILMKF